MDQELIDGMKLTKDDLLRYLDEGEPVEVAQRPVVTVQHPSSMPDAHIYWSFDVEQGFCSVSFTSKIQELNYTANPGAARELVGLAD